MTDRIKLFQHNTLSALMAGLYAGNLTIDELLTHGDLGIGTVDSIDGELIVLDGKAYQARGDKTITELPGDSLVPYAAVIPHEAEVIGIQRTEITSEDLSEKMESYFDGYNLFRSIKIEGTFKKMHVRMITRAENGERFAKVAEVQPEYIEENVKGTVVGIWTPEMFHGVSVAGFHLHFLSNDHSFGGHVLDYVLEKGQFELGPVHELEQSFPTNDKNFLRADLDVERLKKDIDLSE
ncbi:alpha-acetolactate decarboxylase [Floricoccus tropicus]|uniref:Alpha-acetolactate decarboxylase n=1 Tax=Floricoccus tropicus TaxID=1859473 RepID=A0A1E8GME6_9LACT|nr:acetolactate decarboxylase [Floricoccus tropicus]OFI49415.1 alpha-acetolactate decarboxylase [Floricoccus tropicus]